MSTAGAAGAARPRRCARPARGRRRRRRLDPSQTQQRPQRQCDDEEARQSRQRFRRARSLQFLLPRDLAAGKVLAHVGLDVVDDAADLVGGLATARTEAQGERLVGRAALLRDRVLGHCDALGEQCGQPLDACELLRLVTQHVTQLVEPGGSLTARRVERLKVGIAASKRVAASAALDVDGGRRERMQRRENLLALRGRVSGCVQSGNTPDGDPRRADRVRGGERKQQRAEQEDTARHASGPEASRRVSAACSTASSGSAAHPGGGDHSARNDYPGNRPNGHYGRRGVRAAVSIAQASKDDATAFRGSTARRACIGRHGATNRLNNF